MFDEMFKPEGACYYRRTVIEKKEVVVDADKSRSLNLFKEVSLLQKYESDVKTANIVMMALLDGVQKAYSVDFGLLNLIHVAALHGANCVPPPKRNIISYASGEQRLPIFA